MLTWLPYYLVHERHWSMTRMAEIGGGAYVVLALATICAGWLGDRSIAAGASPTVMRKRQLGVGSVWVAVCLLGCVTSSAGWSVAWLVLASIGEGLISPNIFAVSQAIAGSSAAGRWVGIQNCIANGAGVIAPY